MNYYNKIKGDLSGHLLMNVLVSVGVVALLSTIAIPYLRQYQPNLKLNGTARELVSDLRYAQQLTVTEQVLHMVKFYFEDDKYKILKIDTATTTIKEVVFPEEVSFQSITNLTDNEVEFNSYGAVNESGTVILINTNDKQSTINIKPSGYMQLQ